MGDRLLADRAVLPPAAPPHLANAAVGLCVVHVVRQFAPSVGGLEDAVLNLARHQRHLLGLDARIVTLDRVFTDPGRTLPRTGEIAGLPITRLGWKGSSRYPLAPAVLAAIRGADIVHVHGIDFFFDFLAVTRPIHRRRMVASTHGGFFHTRFASGLKRAWFNTLTRRTARAYDAIIACSENDAALFAPLDLPWLATIENGIDAAKVASQGAVERHPRRIVSFGRFAGHKRITLLFKLLAALRHRDPGWELVVAGSPADQDLATLQQAAAAEGVAEAVRFRLAPTDAELAEELAGASFYASASAHEGFGLAAAEAASAGLIPLLSAIPPFRRLIDRLGDGVLFDPLDADKAAAAVLAQMVDPPRMAERHARIAEAAWVYDWRSAAAAYVGLYDRVLLAEKRREAA